MLRIIICDDDKIGLEGIEAACKKYLSEHAKTEAEIVSFANPLLCLERLERIGGCDIALLDICMPGITGIAAGREIMKMNPKTQLMYLTTSDEFAVEAFALGAVHYLVKPFTQEQFDTGMDRIMRVFEKVPTKNLLVNDEGGTIHRIDAQSILYVESFRNGRSVRTADGGTYVERKLTLQKMLDNLTQLCPGQFVSPYRGYIVNFEKVSSISKDGIVLKDRSIIPIKPDSFRKLRDTYMEYVFSKEACGTWNF